MRALATVLICALVAYAAFAAYRLTRAPRTDPGPAQHVPPLGLSPAVEHYTS